MPIFETGSPKRRPEAEVEEGGNPSSSKRASEGDHTDEPIDLLREEIRQATTLDLNRYFSDIDYRLSVSENALVSRFEDDAVVRALWQIASRANEIGLSSGQVANMLRVFEPNIQQEVAKILQGEEVAKVLYQTRDDSRTNYVN